jgi:hypothetical protein
MGFPLTYLAEGGGQARIRLKGGKVTAIELPR